MFGVTKNDGPFGAGQRQQVRNHYLVHLVERARTGAA